jgi:hypothetical protein
MPALQHFKEEEEEDVEPYVDDKQSRYGPSITHTPPRRGSDEKVPLRDQDEIASYEEQRRRFKERSQSGDRNRTSGDSPPRPPPHGRRQSPPDRGNGGGNSGAFI